MARQPKLYRDYPMLGMRMPSLTQGCIRACGWRSERESSMGAMLKRFATVLLLLSVAGAQDSKPLPETPQPQYQYTYSDPGGPVVTRDVFVTRIKPDHHKRNFWIAFGLTSAATSALVIWKMRQPHCNHYEYGQSGVGMPCPVEPKSDAK